MNIPYIGEMGTGALLATLAILILFYIWFINPRILKKKTKDYVSMGLAALVAGLYLTNSLYITGTPITLNVGGNLPITIVPYMKSYSGEGYNDIMNFRVYLIRESAWATYGYIFSPLLGGEDEPLKFTGQSIEAPISNALKASSSFTLTYVTSKTPLASFTPTTSEPIDPKVAAGTYREVEVAVLAQCNPSTCSPAIALAKVRKVTITNPDPVDPVDPHQDPYCGDTICQKDDETCGNCAKDCGNCTPGDSCGKNGCETDKGETYANCPADCKAPTCEPGPTEAYTCLEGNSMQLYYTSECTTTPVLAEKCTYSCDTTSGTCISSIPSVKTCSQLGGEIYNSSIETCEKPLPAGGSTCCDGKPIPKGDSDIQLALLLIVVLVILIIIIAVLFKRNKPGAPPGWYQSKPLGYYGGGGYT